VEDLKRYLQECEIIRSCTRLALSNPSLDPELRDEYEIACMRLNAEIRDLKMRMNNVPKKKHSPGAL
jgi:hypothetical protein